MVNPYEFYSEERAALSSTKSQFLANMSHEIRTPLNSIIGMADLLAETPLTDEQREYIRIFKIAGETLLSLVNDMLDISNIESGKIQLDCCPFNLRKLVLDAADLISVRAGLKQLSINCTLDQSLPEIVCGDQGRLKQILLNLLDNAVKFTCQGQISLQVSLAQEQSPAADEVCLLFSVSDTGPGIPKDSLKEIFELFTQMDQSSTRQHGGIGLGLTLSKKLVSLMKGEMWAESTLGKGSTFYFTARFKLLEQEQGLNGQQDSQPTGACDTRPLKILLVEDSPDNRFLIQRYLKTTPHQLDIAVDGQGAVTKVQAKRYDLILMDIQMPVMDGYEATILIRAWENMNGKVPVPIIALTAYAMAEDVERALKCGFTSHLAKPIKKLTLLKLLQQYSAQETQAI